MKVAVYLRKSRSDPEAETIEETLNRHKKTLLQFAKNNRLTILEFYEEVVSGDGLFVRPEMIRLMSAIEKNKYEGVLCMDIDRLGRVNTKDRGIILETFKSNNTKIVTPRKIYDLNDELDEFSTEIEMLFARQELKKITQRLQAGVRRSVEDGYHVGEPPYGYRRIYVDRRPTLEIHEEEAKVIRMVFDMYVNQGYGSQSIADTLNSMGLHPRKSTQFGRTTIQFYLQNPIYIGKIIWNKRRHIKKKSLEDKHHSELNPENEWIVSTGVHQPIIDEETFNKAQKIRLTRSHPPSFTGELRNPLAGIIRCKKCGKLMSRQTSRITEPRLLCITKGCMPSTTIERVEEVLKVALANALSDFETQATILQEQYNEQSNEVKALEAAINDIKKQLIILQKQKERLHDLLEQGIYDIHTFTERGNVISDNILKLSQSQAEFEEKLNQTASLNTFDEVIPKLKKLVMEYDNLTVFEKNTILKSLLECIYYSKEKMFHGPIELTLVFKKWL